jgi:hypothetical protein
MMRTCSTYTGIEAESGDEVGEGVAPACYGSNALIGERCL